MQISELSAIVSAAVAHVLQLEDELPPNADLFKLGMTSLRVVQTIVELENRLNVSVPDDLVCVQDFTDVNSIVAMLDRSE